MLLCYYLCRSLWPPEFCPISVRSQIYTPKSLLYMMKSLLLCPKICLFGFHCVSNIREWVLVRRLWSLDNDGACAMCGRGEGGRGQVGDRNFFASVRAKLFWCAIYCANPKPDPKSQSGSQSCRGMERRAPQIMQEFDLTNAITIHLLTNPRTCEMGPSSFPAMSWLKFKKMTRASFPSMPFNKSKNKEKCLRCSWQCLPCLSLFYFSQKSRRWFIGSLLWCWKFPP